MIRRLKLFFSNRKKRKKAELVGAAQDGHLDQVRKLLRGGTDPNARCKDGFTALMWASARGHIEVVGVLLDSGAEPLARARRGRTAIEIAIQEGRSEVAALLRERTS
ncbi:MAG: ankyrin repeat domain-containing protein [Pirellulales bacterium]|nr:ankyrin repeat domain-containing protein [Pirellulales bacterium]